MEEAVNNILAVLAFDDDKRSSDIAGGELKT